jgi:peptidoglycan hydrolase-like protein with peptidoglycan-binding domain
LNQSGHESDAGKTDTSGRTTPLRIYLTRRVGRHYLRNAQEILHSLGFYEAEIDGLMGPKTWRAIRDFQKATNMAATGVLSDATVKVLEAAYGIAERPVGHLYVRQEQKPIFDLPVQFANPDLPLGDHLLTASAASGPVEWIALSMETRNAERALAAFERFDIPRSARTRIENLLTPHSSIAISDTGLGPETGAGTDFIVIKR